MTAPTASPAPATPRPGRKGERTRERILDAAEALFAERGYEGTTLRDVAARVKLRNPSLYNHFESKESLYAAVLERGLGPLLRLLGDYVGSDRDARDAGEELLGVVMQLLAERPALPRLVQHETLTGGQRLTPTLRSFLAPIIARGFAAAEPRARAAGWQEDDVPLLLQAMVQMVLGCFTFAPLYQDLDGEDLLADEALARQTRFLNQLTQRLFEPR